MDTERNMVLESTKSDEVGDNETEAVKRWFASEYKKQIDVWEKGVKNGTISKTDFVAFANFSKFIKGMF